MSSGKERMEVPQGIIDELHRMVDETPQGVLLDYAKGHREISHGFPLELKNLTRFKSRIKDSIKSPLRVDGLPHDVLRKADLYNSFMIVLSEEAVKEGLESFLAHFGTDTFLANMIIDQREEIRKMAFDYISDNYSGGEKNSIQSHQVVPIRKTFGPFLDKIRPFIETVQTQNDILEDSAALNDELQNVKKTLQRSKEKEEESLKKISAMKNSIKTLHNDNSNLRKEHSKLKKDNSDLMRRLKEEDCPTDIAASKENGLFRENSNILLQDEKTEYDRLCEGIAEKESEKKNLEKSIADLHKLDEVLDNCINNACEYRHKFEEKRNGTIERVVRSAEERKFHFFMCFRDHYYIVDSHVPKTIVDAHREIIRTNPKKYVWWGKFYKERIDDSEFRPLEPFGESLTVAEHGSVAVRIRDNVMKRIGSGENLYLFNYNPNPASIELYRCNIIDLWFGNEGIPPSKGGEGSIPECSKFPEYYFINHKKGDCQKCRKREPSKCDLRFSVNFWFKINKIEKQDNPAEEFLKLENCYTNDSINLAIPILYPLLVYQKSEALPHVEILKKKGFNSILIITDKISSVERIREWLGVASDFRVEKYIVEYDKAKLLNNFLKTNTYLGDILVYEFGNLRHLKDFEGNLTRDHRKKYKELASGHNFQEIKGILSSMIGD